MLNICIGIPSYFPEIEPNRTKRINRFNELLTTLSSMGPHLDILIIAQNGKDHQPNTTNKLIIDKYDEPLTIIKARHALREKFLSLNYDYMIMLDDDAVIHCDSPEAAVQYLLEINNHPDGFCFIHSPDHWHDCDDYARAPLNLCAISRYIYEREAIPNVTLEDDEALEDDLFAVLLHFKYPEHEFLPPAGIYHVHNVKNQYIAQLTKPNLVVPSTWYRHDTQHPTKFFAVCQNTVIAMNYIKEHKDLDLEAVKKMRDGKVVPKKD